MQGRAEVSKTKTVISALAFVLWCVCGALVMFFARLFKLELVERFPLTFHGVVAQLCSLQCESDGTPSIDKPTLFVANHASYLDVFVLGSLIPGSFVAKSEVAGWPIFGQLARLQNTLFLERKAMRAVDQLRVVADFLKTRGSLIMFPEGTSTNGSYVARFRSSLFAAALDKGVTIQPITVAYLDYDGVPMTQAQRDRYAWYLPDPRAQPPRPNAPFGSHLLAVLGLGRCRVKVTFHKPLKATSLSRKECANHCESIIRQGLEAALRAPENGEKNAQLSSAT